VKRGLFQALNIYRLVQGLDWIVLAARAPLDRQYKAIRFTDVFFDRGYVEIREAAPPKARLRARICSEAQ
jgi:hypothetical protein